MVVFHDQIYQSGMLQTILLENIHIFQSEWQARFKAAMIVYKGLSKIKWTFPITTMVQANIFKFQLTINCLNLLDSESLVDLKCFISSW